MRGARSLAVSDDYLFWQQRDEHSTSGKLMLMHDEVSGDGNVHHVFFDDNIWQPTNDADYALIVDVRSHGTPVHYRDAIDKHLIHVKPIDVLLNPNYFLEQLRRISVLA
jgi:hypothetical protein